MSTNQDAKNAKIANDFLKWNAALKKAPYHLKKLISICDLDIEEDQVVLDYRGSDRACIELLLTHFDGLKELIRKGFDPIYFEIRTSKETRQVLLKDKFQVSATALLSDDVLLCEIDYSNDPRWQALIKKTTLQLHAFLKPALITITPSLITIEFAEKSTFHGIQTLRKSNELAQLVADMFGSITLEIITQEQRQTIDVVAGKNYLDKQSPEPPNFDAADHKTVSKQPQISGGAKPERSASTEPTTAQEILYFGQLTPDNTTSAPSGTLSDISLADHVASNLRAGTIHASTLIPDGRRELFSVGSLIVWIPEATPRRGDYQLVRLQSGRYGIGIYEAPPLQTYVTAEADPSVEWSATLEKASLLGTLVQVRTKLSQ